MARNLGLLMRHLFGIGTARGLQAGGGLAEGLYFTTLNKFAWLEKLLGVTAMQLTQNQAKIRTDQHSALAA